MESQPEPKPKAKPKKRKKSRISRDKKGIAHATVGKQRRDDGTLGHVRFYFGKVSDDDALTMRAKLRAAWKQLQAQGHDHWTDDMIDRLLSQGVVTHIAGRGLKTKNAIADVMNHHQITREQMKELDRYRDGRGVFKADCHGAVVVHVLGQVLTSPKGLTIVRDYFDGLLDRGQVPQALELFKLANELGPEEQQASAEKITLNIFRADKPKQVDARVIEEPDRIAGDTAGDGEVQGES